MLNYDRARQQDPPLEDIFQLRHSTNLKSSIHLTLQLSSKLFDALKLPKVPVINSIKQGGSFYEQVISVLEEVHNTLGVLQPQFQIVPEDSLGCGEFLIQIQERIIYRDKAEIGHIWTSASEDLLRSLKIFLARQARHPITGYPVAWIPQDSRSKLENLGVVVKKLPEYILFILSEMAWKFSDHFLNCDEVSKLLESIKQNNDILRSRLDSSAIGTDEVASILRHLLRHIVSILNLEEIIEKIIDLRIANRDISTNAIAEHLFSKFKSDRVLLEISPQIAELINSNQLQTGDLRKNKISLLQALLLGFNGIIGKLFKRMSSDTLEQATENKINKELLSLMYDGLFGELGVYIPRVEMQVDNELAPDTFRVKVNQVLRTTEKVPLNYQLLNCSHEVLERNIQQTLSPPRDLRLNEIPIIWLLIREINPVAGILFLRNSPTSIPAINPANGNTATWVFNEKKEIISSERFHKWDIASYLVLSLSAVLRRCAAEFIGINEVEYAIEKIGQSFPKLLSVVKQKFTDDQITIVLRNLVREGISIKDLRLILEFMTESDLIRQSTFSLSSKDYPTDLEFPYGIDDLMALTEYVRQGLKLYVSHKYTYAKGQSTLLVYLLDSEVENLVRKNINKSKFGISLKLNNVDAQKILKAIDEELDVTYYSTKSSVMLTNAPIRPHLQQLITSKFPYLPVLSFQELSPSTNVKPISRIKFETGNVG